MTNPQSTAWQQTRRRQHALSALCQAISHDPAAIDGVVRDAAAEFDSLDDLLVAAHLMWSRSFEARMDLLLESGAYGDQTAFDELWDATAHDLRGVALLLDRFSDHPAVIAAHRTHARRTRHALAVDLPPRWASLHAAA